LRSLEVGFFIARMMVLIFGVYLPESVLIAFKTTPII